MEKHEICERKDTGEVGGKRRYNALNRRGKWGRRRWKVK
jgi:hypothetical protein